MLKPVPESWVWLDALAGKVDLDFAAAVRERLEMRLTQAFDETVQARLHTDRTYRKKLLREGVECVLAGDVDAGKAILRDYINATIGFEELSRRTKRPAKSLMRMLGPTGNPEARNLLEVIHYLQKAEGLQQIRSTE